MMPRYSSFWLISRRQRVGALLFPTVTQPSSPRAKSLDTIWALAPAATSRPIASPSKAKPRGRHLWQSIARSMSSRHGRCSIPAPGRNFPGAGLTLRT